MEQLTDILRFATAGILLTCMVNMIQSPIERKQGWPAALFCFGVFCYLFLDWGKPEHPLGLIFLAPAFAAPFFFWLLNKALFDDHFQFRKWMAVVLVLFVAFNYFVFLTHHFNWAWASDSTQSVIMLARHATALVFVGLGIMEASRDREADLILSRLKFRNTIMLLAAALIGATILGEMAFPEDDAPRWLDLLQKAVIFGLTFYFAFRRFDFRPGFFSEKITAEPSPPKPEIDRALINQLLGLVEGQKFYRTEGLTIRRLADELKVKEYKLRQAINQHLGFRNFNDFLNSYRIAEACDLLKDPTKKELTVLEIAFQLGFNSLAPFNKAFKQTTGMTPTQWRRENESLRK